MTASATFVYAQKDDALRLPNGALRFKPDAATAAAMQGEPTTKGAGAKGKGGEPALGAGERRVWILRGGQAHEVTVKVGITDGTTTEVVDGDVRESDTAVTEVVVEGAASKHP
jgi:HlyD family secretion protein